MLLLLGSALAVNCGSDSGSPSPSEGGMGSEASGAPGNAGEGAGGNVSAGGKPMAEGGGPAAAGAPDQGGGPPVGEGGAGGVGGSGGPDVCPEAIEDYPGVLADAICRKRAACCTSDVEACMTEVTAALDEIYPGLAAAEQSGAADADCSALELCVAAIDDADCSNWPKELGAVYGIPVAEPACRGIIKGNLAPSAACESTYQCADGFCAEQGDALICFAHVPDGEACGGSNYCNLATSYCNAADECAPREENGVACTNDQQCQSRICDTEDTGACIAPDASQCEYVPEGCSMSGRPARGHLGWSLLVVGLVLGAAGRRRLRAN